MTKEALKLALEAYLCREMPAGTVIGDPKWWAAKIANAIKAALAQPEQEPLEYWNAVEGWVKINEVREHFDSVGCGTIYKTAGEDRVPVYTTPPQRTWVGLTEDEAIELLPEGDWEIESTLDFAQAIEAKLKEKNNG